jgi:hypothetical protein
MLQGNQYFDSIGDLSKEKDPGNLGTKEKLESRKASKASSPSKNQLALSLM